MKLLQSLLVIFSCYSISGVASDEFSQGEIKTPVKVELTLSRIDDSIMAHLIFKNLSSDRVLLSRYSTGILGDVETSLFEVRCGEDEVRFSGKNIHRDWTGYISAVEILAGKSREMSIEISRYYTIEKCAEKLIVRYYAGSSSNESIGEVILLKSNVVVLDISK